METLTFIPLRTVRYSDRANILLAYSREHGPVSLLVPAGGGREASRIRSVLQPLGLIEGQVDIRPGREIYRLSQPRPLEVFANVSLHPGRRMAAQFLAEVLSVVLREGTADEAMFHFLSESVKILDSSPEVANYPLVFLFSLARVLGIAPDVATYLPGAVFDMVDAVFRPTLPLAHRNFLSPEDSAVLARLARISFSNMRAFRFDRAERNRALDLVLDYFTLHYAPLRSLSSLAILRSLV